MLNPPMNDLPASSGDGFQYLTVPKSMNTIIQQACSRLTPSFRGGEEDEGGSSAHKSLEVCIAVEKSSYICGSLGRLAREKTAKDALENLGKPRWNQSYAARKLGARSSKVVQPADERPLFT
jgi:hypothetical protein